jgi:hypothetical protein
MDPQPSTMGKAISALGGGTIGAAIMQVIAWALLQYTQVDMPATVQMAGASIFSTVLAVVAAHFTPVGPPLPPSG